MNSDAESKNDVSHRLNVLVYGIERKGFNAPEEPIQTRECNIQFAPFDTRQRFQEFDGVILFQGIFEKFNLSQNYSGSHLAHHCERDELDKRKKEADLLLRGGGFLCFLLSETFLDQDGGRNFEGTDLAKFHLNYRNFYRKNFSNRVTQLRILRDEFRQFLQVYGAASSHFQNLNDNIHWHVIAEAFRKVCGMILNEQEYFVPTLLPENHPECLNDYFSQLATAITTTAMRLDQSPLAWTEEFEFDEEVILREELQSWRARAEQIEARMEQLAAYKGVLCWSGESLVDAVGTVLRTGFNYRINAVDEFREDLTILDDEGQPLCLCEIKGTNRGVKREHINQADSHRERSGFSKEFPVLLIINTALKGARSVKKKDQSIAAEQVRHAKAMGVLILRTLDLVRLLRLYQRDEISQNDVSRLLATSAGWLRVADSGWAIQVGDE